MSAQLLKGKIIAEKIKGNLKKEIESFKQKYQISPRLASIQIGDDPGSEIYIKSQQKNAAALGIEFDLCKLDPKITQDKLIDYLKKLNQKY